MVDFFLKRIYRTKYHMLYAAMAQVMLMAINVLILLSSNFEIPYTIFQSVVPTYFYLFFTVLFYLLIDKQNRRTSRQNLFTTILTYTIILLNVVYTFITTFDENGVLYYLDTVIVQTVNAFYMIVYVTASGRQFAVGNQLNLMRVFSYGSTIAALLAFYYCFVNMLVAWAFIIITTALLFSTYLVLYENYKRTLPKKKVLRTRVRK